MPTNQFKTFRGVTALSSLMLTRAEWQSQARASYTLLRHGPLTVPLTQAKSSADASVVDRLN